VTSRRISDWYEHPRYPGILVSDSGVVLSNLSGREWIELKQSDNGSGYLRVGIGHGNPQYVHRLVAEVFVFNPRPDIKVEVNHLDGDKHNNYAENLEWVTEAENWEHAMSTGLRSRPKGRAVRIIETGEVFPSIAECARSINGIQGNIAWCLLGTRQTHRGYHFEYAEGENRW
jgi:hypothetical protein